MLEMDKKRQEEICSAYSKAATKYGELFFFELQNKPLDRKIYDLFYERAVNNGISLEIGCGPGEISNYLWMKGLDIVGIDYSSEMIRIAKRYNDKIKYRIGNVFSLDYQNETVGGIVAPYLIVNFEKEDLNKAFSEMYRVLKNNCYMLLSFHIGEDDKHIFDDFIVHDNKLQYVFYRVDTVQEALEMVGFKIIEVITKTPYEGEVTKRCYIFCKK